MNVLELEKAIRVEQIKLRNLRLNNFQIIATPDFNEQITFMVWDKKSPSGTWLLFNEDLEIIENLDYTHDIEAAREALKQYLAQEVE